MFWGCTRTSTALNGNLGKVPDTKLQRLTGHRTQAMTERYSHFRMDDFADVIRIQEEWAI